jgi:hypothetical protein
VGLRRGRSGRLRRILGDNGIAQHYTFQAGHSRPFPGYEGFYYKQQKQSAFTSGLLHGAVYAVHAVRAVKMFPACDSSLIGELSGGLQSARRAGHQRPKKAWACAADRWRHALFVCCSSGTTRSGALLRAHLAPTHLWSTQFFRRQECTEETPRAVIPLFCDSLFICIISVWLPPRMEC